MSKRITASRSKPWLRSRSSSGLPGEWSPAHDQYDETLYRLTGIRRVLSSADEDLIDQVMANCGYSGEEAIDRQGFLAVIMSVDRT